MRSLFIIEAEYIADYKLRLSFSDGITQTVDFGPFLIDHPHPQHNKYRDLLNFKQFHIEQLHQGYLAPAVY
jgi:hypothetical protein